MLYMLWLGRLDFWFVPRFLQANDTTSTPWDEAGGMIAETTGDG